MQKSANGTLILILGILSFVGFGCVTGLPAWLLGNSALKEIDAGQADASERGIVQAGRILGMIACLVIIAVILIWGIFLGGLIAIVGSQPHAR